MLSRPPLLIGLVSALLIGLTTPLLLRELAAQRVLLVAAREPAEAVRAAPLFEAGPIAQRTLRPLLERCLQGVLDWRVPILPADRRAGVLDGCEQLSAAALKRAPALAEAMILSAAVSARRADPIGAGASLDRSRAAFPRDVWSAEARVRIAALLPDPGGAGVGPDLDLLVAHWRGRPVLAALYRDRTGLRGPILEAVRRADPVEARRALNLIEAEEGAT